MTAAAPVHAAPGLLDRFAGSTRALSAMRAPTLMAIITILALWLPEQIREVYRVLLQRGYETHAVGLQWQWIMAAISLLLLGLVFWQATRELTHLVSKDEDLDREPIAKALLDWFPRLLATAPFIGAGLGLWYSFLPDKRVLTDADKIPELLKPIVVDAGRLQSALAIQTVAAFVAAAVLFLAITVFERWLLKVGPGRKLTQTRGRQLFLISHWFLFPLVGLLSMLAIALWPILLPQYFGVIPIFALWVAISVVLTSAGTRFYDRFGIPLVTLVIVAGLCFQFAGWNDNHRFRHSKQTVGRASLDEAFADWIGSRKDVAAYAGREYPVYIITAEGGGIYAAQHAARVLSRIQDLCPNFAQHVFAASTVSGGSLGTAVFTALAQKRARNGPAQPCKQNYEPVAGSLEAEAESLLTHDFLSPLVWATFFPDFVQRFLPFPIYGFDRAVTLEKNFEYVWDAKFGGDNPFRNSLFALCGPGARTCAKEDVAAPALLLNTTNVETGAQMILSPLYLGQTYILGTGALEDFHRKSAEINEIPLSTAVGLSARFPWILPVGWYDFTVPAPLDTTEPPQERRMTFVDGGYYEGSGVATAENLAQYLLKYAELNPELLKGIKIAPKIIMITGSYQPVDNFYQTKAAKKSYDELTAPLSALLLAWRARSSSVPAEAEADRSRGAYITRSAQFNNEYLPLPVGWQLADLSRKYLDLFTGRPQNCMRRAGRNLLDEEIRGALKSIHDNDCLLRSIIDDLRPPP